jgi:hypothetical protein
MSTKLMYCISLVLMITQAGIAVEVARWDFDETSGTTATDQSGVYVANLEGGDTLDVDGKFGSGLDLAGDGGLTADAASVDALRFTGDFSIALWIYPNGDVADYARFVDMSAADGGLADSYRLMTGTGDNSDNFRFMSRQSGSNTSIFHSRAIAVGTWNLLVVRHDLDGDIAMNVLQDGDTVDAAFVAANAEGAATAGPIEYAAGDLKLGRLIGTGRKFTGLMDGVVFYDEVLTDADVADIYNKAPASEPIAASPTPADEAIDVLRNAALSWESGELANTHTLYVGSVFEDVNNASTADPLGALIEQGLTASSFDPGVLEFGQTYYWRVDEVNGAPDRTVFEGDVWSFTVEPIAIPITTVTATASGANPGMEPSKTVDGSGLNALGQHSSAGTDMWLALTADSWIQYEFDKAYKLHDMLIWNSNQLVETFIGFGVKDAVVETSLDGVTWTVVEGVGPFAKGSGQDTYVANTTVDLSGIVAQYVKISPQSGHGLSGQTGLSEVRISYVPTDARELSPADGSTSASAEVTLSWRAGREAASHQVYLGTDAANLALVGTTDESAFVAEDLDYAQTYYWQVVEVNEAETPATYTSEIQRFNTPAFATVDDFESYSGSEGQEVFMTWLDGFGGDASLGGSTTGHIDGPFVETTNVHSGNQSMPIFYDNDGGFIDIDGKSSSPTFSEVLREFDSPQDWTAGGIKTLSLVFRGEIGNTGQLYGKINSTRLDYDGDPGDIQQAQWHVWNIDLSSVNGAQSVRELAFGVEGGTTGALYLDSIRLYPGTSELITPVQPGTTHLIAHLAFEGNTTDSASGLNGTLVGSANFAPGQQDQALNLNTVTVTDYLELTGYKGVLGTNSFSISLWIKTAETIEQQIVYYGTHVGGQRCEFRIHSNGHIRIGNGSGQVEGFTDVTDDRWHHVAVTVRENATNSSTDVRVYVDGLDDTQESADPDAYDIVAEWDVTIGYRPSQDDRYVIGAIDEFRIYDDVLSAAEIAGLAGRTAPIHKPF